MKTIKTLFAIVVLSTMFIACEADSVNEEVGIELEDVDTLGTENTGEEEIDPTK